MDILCVEVKQKAHLQALLQAHSGNDAQCGVLWRLIEQRRNPHMDDDEHKQYDDEGVQQEQYAENGTPMI